MSTLKLDTQIQRDVLRFRINQTTLQGKSLCTLPDFVHPDDVKRQVNDLNEVGNDLIVDYHYTRENKQTLLVQALFKPLFTKFGVTQKYAQFRVTRVDVRAFQCDRVAEPLEIRVPSGLTPVPVRKITVRQNDEPTPHILIELTLDAPVDSYEPHDVVIGFVKKLVQRMYEHLSSDATAKSTP